MSEFRLYTPEGASMDLDMLISVLEGKAEKAKATHEGQRRVLDGTYLRNAEALQKASAEVGVEIGLEIAFRQSADLLKAVKKKLVAKSAA